MEILVPLNGQGRQTEGLTGSWQEGLASDHGAKSQDSPALCPAQLCDCHSISASKMEEKSGVRDSVCKALYF